MPTTSPPADSFNMCSLKEAAALLSEGAVARHLLEGTLKASVPSLTKDSRRERKMRFFWDAEAMLHLAVSCGSGGAGGLGGGPQHTAEAGLAGAHRADVGGRRRDDGGGARLGQEQAHGRALAGALSGARRRGAAARRQPARPQAAVVGF